MVVLGGSTTKITLKHFLLKMSSVIEEVTAGLREARESLRIAVEEFREWKVANQPLDITHPTYLDLKAEVTACRTVLAGAQRNYDNTIAAPNRGKLVV